MVSGVFSYADEQMIERYYKVLKAHTLMVVRGFIFQLESFLFF